MQLRNCGVDVVWLRDVMYELGMGKTIDQSTVIYCDSAGAIDWAKFGKVTPGNKHIALAYHDIQQWVQIDCVITLIKIPTQLNLADLFTKNITKEMVEKLLKWLCGYNKPPKEFTLWINQEILKTKKRAKIALNGVKVPVMSS